MYNYISTLHKEKEIIRNIDIKTYDGGVYIGPKYKTHYHVL